MKQFPFLAGFFIMTTFHASAQSKTEEHLLDGTSFDNTYESGSREHIEFIDGQMVSTWIAGPGKDNATGRENYRSKKIGDKMYIVNWLKTPSHSFCTLIINFNQNVLYASAIRGVGMTNEAIYLEEATIDHLHLNEK